MRRSRIPQLCCFLLVLACLGPPLEAQFARHPACQHGSDGTAPPEGVVDTQVIIWPAEWTEWERESVLRDLPLVVAAAATDPAAPDRALSEGRQDRVRIVCRRVLTPAGLGHGARWARLTYD